MSYTQEYIPKSSVEEINLLTPENKTYEHPDKGFYLATYGFENETMGTIPAGWIIWPGSTQVSVIDEIGRHKKVLEFYDTKSLSESTAYNSFSGQSNGTIECWIRTSDASQRYVIYLLEGENDYKVILYFDNNELQYKDSTSVKTICGGIISNHWYHLRIDFECATGTYKGLDADHFKLFLDGNEYGSFNFNTPGNYVTEFYAGSDMLSSNIYCYLDAVGYSWDPAYEIGDNLKEGLLLSFDNSTNLNWQGYSLDGASNKTIFGNTIIPFPTDGHHHIQIFGIDSLGNPYKSTLRYFSIDSTLPYISILNPLQNSYFSSLSPTFQLAISGENLSSSYYQIGASKILFETNKTQVSQDLWNNCAEGLILVRFYLNNTFGNYSIAEITVYKDTLSPSIVIDFPNEGEVCYWAPYLNLDIFDANLDLMWYTLNDDRGKCYFTGSDFGIDQGVWSILDDGVVTITIHATDKAGNENSYEFYVIKEAYIDQPYDPPSYPPLLAIAIGGILLMAIIVAIVVVYVNKNSQPRATRVYQDQTPYYSPPRITKQPQYSVPKRMKCPYCSNEEDIDGNFCPQCGARLK